MRKKSECIVDEVSREFGITLKHQQREAITLFLKGKDVFCCLPIGYGKSMCYSLLPRVFNRYRCLPGTSIVICISPLVALMVDQKEKFTSMGIKAEFISENVKIIEVTHCINYYH